MDIVVVDDLYPQPLGKPYLTLATDVATGCILGFVISLVPPSAGTVSLCMTLSASPKTAWLKELGVVGEWPMAGLPKTLHLDGAAEFKSKAQRRGCAQYVTEPAPGASTSRRAHRATDRHQDEQAQVPAGCCIFRPLMSMRSSST